MSDLVRLALAVVLPQVTGAVAGLATARGSGAWMRSLERPPWRPPAEVFGPVWTLLYLLMGIGSFLVWREGLDVPVVRWALAAYLVQLALNAAWPFAFFGARSPGAGLIVLLLLAPAVLATLLLFWHVSDAAGWLLLPYAVWTGFALALNASIWARN